MVSTKKGKKKEESSSKGGRPKLPDSERRMEQISLRGRPDILDKYQAAVFLRGANMSLEIHKFMVEYIRAEEAANPKELERVAKEIRQRKEAKRKERSDRSDRS